MKKTSDNFKLLFVMFNFKGIRMYLYVAMIVLIFQILKLVNYVHSMEACAFVALFITICLTLKLTIYDQKLRDIKYWLFIVQLLVQEVILGLDQIIAVTCYNIMLMCMLIMSVSIYICFDAPSVRRHMDDDAYVLKNACSIQTLAITIAVIDILARYMFFSNIPI